MMMMMSRRSRAVYLSKAQILQLPLSDPDAPTGDVGLVQKRQRRHIADCFLAEALQVLKTCGKRQRRILL
jgi:hypothetical protein